MYEYDLPQPASPLSRAGCRRSPRHMCISIFLTHRSWQYLDMASITSVLRPSVSMRGRLPVRLIVYSSSSTPLPVLMSPVAAVVACVATASVSFCILRDTHTTPLLLGGAGGLGG